MCTKIMVKSVQSDDGLARMFVKTISGKSLEKAGHGGSESWQNRMYGFGKPISAALPDAGRFAKSRDRQDLHQVGDTGLEPVTSGV